MGPAACQSTLVRAPARLGLPVHLGPEPIPVLERAIVESGGRLVPLRMAEVVIWTSTDPTSWTSAGVPENVRWVQLLSAGVEQWIEAGVIDQKRIWTSASGGSAMTVAEHALALLLAIKRRLVECARASSWRQIEGQSLQGSTALIVGCGSIGRALIPMLASLEVECIAVTRSGSLVKGAIESHDPSGLSRLWSRADAVILAAPATKATRHLVNRQALARMPSHCILVNVARGSLVDTDGLVEALDSDRIAGAGLDVTDPEPLPEGHPLWHRDSVLITPHSANPTVAWQSNVARRTALNIQRYQANEQPIRIIDLERGY